MTPAEKKQAIGDALDYWYLLDFLSQGDQPEDKKNPPRPRKGMLDDCFVPEERDDQYLRTPFEEARERADSVTNGENWPISTIYCHLGSVPREAVMTYIAEKPGNEIEKEDECMTVALLGVSPDGQFVSLELSSLFWWLKRNVGNSLNAIVSFEKEQDEIRNKINEKLNGTKLTYGVIRDLVDSCVRPMIEGIASCLPDGDGAERISEWCSRLLVEYRAMKPKDNGGDAYPVFDQSLCHSFFAKDISRINEQCKSGSFDDLDKGPLPLVAAYLEGGLREESACGEIDLLGGEDDDDLTARADFFSEVLGAGATPIGRWPSKYSLSLMQQVAVNLAVGRGGSTRKYPANDVMSVNGPPGTGKTTLLKDIVAANVVEKARLLCEYDKPDDAFEEVELSKDYLKYAENPYRFKKGRTGDAINSLSILVCSTNNAAVENIAKELPDGKAFWEGIDESEKKEFLESDLSNIVWGKKNEQKPVDDLYFSSALVDNNGNLRDPAHPGLMIAACLGNRRNINNFRDRELSSLQFSGGLGKGKRFSKAKKLFLVQYKKVSDRFDRMEEQAAKKRELLNLKSRLPQLDRECQKDERKIVEELTIETVCLPHPFEGGAAGDVRKYLDDIAKYTADYEERKRALEKELRDAEEKASGRIWSILYKGRVSDCREELDSFMQQTKSEQKLVELRTGFEDKYEELENEKKKLVSLQVKIKGLEDVVKGTKSVETIDERFVESISKGDNESRKSAHLYNPSDDDELKKERNLLFLYALQVTREFILESKCMRNNITFLRTYWGAKDKGADSGKKELIEFTQADRRKMAPALFQALGLLTPVISSTFASIGRMLEDVQIGGAVPLFGLLIIDEAGQAVPYAALGALARSRRAMIVGDPSQIEPVITGDVKELRATLGKKVLLPFKGDMASVQRLADAVNPYGHLRSNGEGDQWIGCPLVVHRRCISPMFDISNEISYQGSMLNETANPKKDLAGSFYLKSSQWINVAGFERGNRDHYVDAQGDRVYEIVKEAFRKTAAATKKKAGGSGEHEECSIPSLYIISPFKTVVSGLKNRLLEETPEGIAERAWSAFAKFNIGTVHTFQGKEAHQVIFVLGCDTSRSCEGAIRFVNPNIVNVAASRAKYRLYVIADYAAWKINENVATMKRILDTAWVEHWEKYQTTGAIEELNAAKDMLPRGESLPREATDADEEHVNEDDWCSDVSTDSYLDNVSEAFKSFNLDAEDCRIIGFSSREALQSAFADCACDQNGKNRVLENIEQGLLLCKIFGIGSVGTDSDSDCAFCLLMFCRAAERYLRLKLLPALKAIAPDYVVARKPLKELESLNLGQYKGLIEKKSELLASSVRVENTELTQASKGDWWRTLGETLGQFTKFRNSACHTDREEMVSAGEVWLALQCLFTAFQLDEHGHKSVEIMREGVVYEAAFAGAERLPVCYSMDQAEAKGYASISKILSVGGSRIRAAKANNILMKQGYLRLFDEGEESVQKCKVPSAKGLSLGAITVRGEKGDGEVYFYAQYPKVKAKDICNIIERES